MNLSNTLAKSLSLLEWIEGAVNEEQAQVSLRLRCAGPCFMMVQEHHAAIYLLLKQDQPVCASAFALVRAVYESLVRGLWLWHCASDKQIQSFSVGGEPPKVPILLEAIKNTEGYSSGHLTSVYEKSWKSMCSYTHSGSLQIQRWNTSSAIESNYTETEIVEVLRFTGSLALISVIGLATISNNNELAQTVLAMSREWAQ